MLPLPWFDLRRLTFLEGLTVDKNGVLASLSLGDLAAISGFRCLLVLSAVDFGSMLDFPPWTATVFSYAGLVLLVLGLMAWLGSHSVYRRSWGLRLTLSGGGLFVVGTAFGTFLDLLQYVFG